MSSSLNLGLLWRCLHSKTLWPTRQLLCNFSKTSPKEESHFPFPSQDWFAPLQFEALTGSLKTKIPHLRCSLSSFAYTYKNGEQDLPAKLNLSKKQEEENKSERNEAGKKQVARQKYPDLKKSLQFLDVFRKKVCGGGGGKQEEEKLKGGGGTWGAATKGSIILNCLEPPISRRIWQNLHYRIQYKRISPSPVIPSAFILNWWAAFSFREEKLTPAQVFQYCFGNWQQDLIISFREGALRRRRKTFKEFQS